MTIKEKAQLYEALRNLKKATKPDNIKPKKNRDFVWTARVILEIILDT